jgi:hypothetical protein
VEERRPEKSFWRSGIWPKGSGMLYLPTGLLIPTFGRLTIGAS